MILKLPRRRPAFVFATLCAVYLGSVSIGLGSIGPGSIGPGRTISESFAGQAEATGRIRVAAASTSQPDAQADTQTPEQKMAARFPQPVKVGDLIGLPVLDGQDRTLGYVEKVVRTPAGKIQLIVPYSSWFGWAKSAGPFSGWRRPVAVPIEVVAILARQINAVDMDRPEFDKASTWVSGDSAAIAPNEVIRIALGRR